MRRSEAAARSAAGRFRFLAETMPQKIFTAKPNGDVDYFNPQWTEFTGLSFEQIQNWGWTQFIHPDDVEENVRVWKHAIETGDPFEFEHRFLRADGEYRWHISRALPMRDDEGKIMMWIGSNTEVHELQEAQAALKEADRRKHEFLATLAHELRNPLAPISNSVQLMRLAGGNEGVIEQARQTIERQLQQMVRLVDDLLDVSRITRNKIELRNERVALSSVVRSAVETSRPLIEASGHELTVTMPPETVWLNADLTRMTQVVANLLNNAANYTPERGRIWLTPELAHGGRQPAGEVLIRVRDTGIGIPREMLPHIFEMFTKVDTSLGRSQGGLGIGLTLVKSLVEMHGGNVRAASAGPGEGSEFTVRLPVASEEQTTPRRY